MRLANGTNMGISMILNEFKSYQKRIFTYQIVSNRIKSYHFLEFYLNFAIYNEGKMKNDIYNFTLKLDWKLIGLLSNIDRFDANWSAIERKEGSSLKELKNIATIESVGASNRIEGNKMSDVEVDTLIKNLDISKLSDRDSQEVVGYFEVLDIISESYYDIIATESQIKDLHNRLMRYSDKDVWHKGNYKLHNNMVEASFPDGSRHIIFQTTEAGYPTEDAMRNLFEWYNTEKEVHSIIKIAAFVYEFLSIHPFQDGNGRLSRLMSTLLLLKNGYNWIQYVSFEHEIERRKSEYYQALRSCQAMRPGEDITQWVEFFLNCLKNVQALLMNKLDRSGIEMQLSARENTIYQLIHNRPNIQSGEIAAKLSIPLPTVKRILADLLEKELIIRTGSGRGISYQIK